MVRCVSAENGRFGLLSGLRLVLLIRFSLLNLIGVRSDVACEFGRRGAFRFRPGAMLHLFHATEQIA